LHSSYTVANEWVTRNTVAPLSTIWRILRKLFSWNNKSPVARASSINRMSGSTLMAVLNVNRARMPLE
jgi:hypothetical protein